MKIGFWILAVGIAAALLAGCGGKGGAETADRCPGGFVNERELSVTVDGYEGPETIGIVMAQNQNYFEYNGLDVSAYVASEPARAVTYVASGSVDLGITHLPQVVLAREKGARVVAIGSLIPRPTAAMIWLKKSQIDGIADLKGKTIAIPGLPFQRDFLESVLAREGLKLSDVKVENVGYDLVPALVSGRADAILGSPNMEGADLEARNLQTVATPVDSLDIPPYDEWVVIARADRLTKDPKPYCEFMSAMARGTAAAIKRPPDALRAAEETDERDFDLSPKALKAQVEATLPLVSKSAYMSPAQANKLVDWMFEQGMIERKLPASALLTNAYRQPSE